MSEKVTFQELLESISGETDRSKQFTHDFLKGLVSVIHEGLEEDRKVNLAGFGKFDLREMDEREGYNPQTGEKMTIPAHNRVAFTPYKRLREQVNAPYADLEPELVEGVEEEKESQESADRDFIPTGPPTQFGSERPEGSPGVESSERESEEGGQVGETESQDSTIVEYEPAEPDPPSPDDREPRADRFDFHKNRRHESSGVNWMLIFAAAFVVLLLAAASWMFTYKGIYQDSPSAGETVTRQAETGTPGVGETGDPAAGPGEEAAREENLTVSREVDEGQTLWSMARAEYGDPYLWPWIYGNNRPEIDNPDLVYAGQSLSVPLPDGPGRSLTENDSLQVALGYVESYRWYRNRDREEAKYFLYAATRYHGEVLDHTAASIDQEDLAFATRPRQ